MMEEMVLDPISKKNQSAAVVVRNAYKGYTPPSLILKNLNLTVPEGVIYGLLGPSGCGKTTLLSCIAGRMSLDSGSVRLKIKKRAEFGYMPQSLSLHDGMTILENFFFYGYLFGLSRQVLEARAAELISFLDLPKGHRLVSELSGGQQRRVSLAITIIHDPKLIILDEPTVGMDPILCKSIWEHLLKMASNGKTIIITTHYIQEARQANVIGLLRNGKLLAEESPGQLMDSCGCDDLEKAFLKLSQIQESEKPKEDTYRPTAPSKIVTFEEDDKFISKIKLSGIMYKNLTLLRREYLFLALLLALPFLTTTNFCLATGRTPKNLKLGVVNDEISLFDCKYNAYRSGTCFLNESSDIALSCLYLDILREKTYDFFKTPLCAGVSVEEESKFAINEFTVEYYNLTNAVEDINRNKIWGLLRFHHNYTRSIVHRFLDGKDVALEFISNSQIESWIDLSSKITGNIIRYDITRLMQTFLKKTAISCGLNPNLLSTPLSLEDPIFGSFDEEFITYTSSAILCTICFFLPSISTAIRIYTEKSGGMLERMLTCGATLNEMMLSIVSIQIFLHLIQCSMVLGIMYTFFHIPLEGSFMALNWLMLFTGLSGMFYGFTLALISGTIMFMGFTGMAMQFSISFTSGMLTSTESAHYLLKSVNWLFPLTLTVDAARGITVRSFSITHPRVIKGFAGTIGWNFVFIFIIYLAIKSRKGSFAS